MAFNLPEEQDPTAPIKSKFTEDGVANLTKGLHAGYPILRASVHYLKVFDHAAFEEYSKIKGNGSVFGEKTPESRKAAYAFALKKAGEIILANYEPEFTSGSANPKDDEGEEWNKG